MDGLEPAVLAAARQAFWSSTKRLTLGLLAAWLTINLGVPWFARELGGLHVLGFPFGYWLAAQGTLLLYLAIIVIYVVAMDRLEARYLCGVDEADGSSINPDGTATASCTANATVMAHQPDRPNPQ